MANFLRICCADFSDNSCNRVDHYNIPLIRDQGSEKFQDMRACGPEDVHSDGRSAYPIRDTAPEFLPQLFPIVFLSPDIPSFRGKSDKNGVAGMQIHTC